MCAEAGGGPEFVLENPHKMSQNQGWRDGLAVKSAVVPSTHTDVSQVPVTPASGDSVLCSGLHNNQMNAGARTHMHIHSVMLAMGRLSQVDSWALWPVSLG